MFKRKQKKNKQQEGPTQPQQNQFPQGQQPPQQPMQNQMQQPNGPQQPQLSPIQIKKMQEAAEVEKRKSFYGDGPVKKGMSDERKEELEAVNKVQNRVRFYNTIRTKDIDFKALRGQKAVIKLLKSKKTKGFNALEQLFNQVAMLIKAPVVLNILTEDTTTGHQYYFNDILLKPGQQFNILTHIQYELSYFTEVENAPQIFLSMNRQYIAEHQLEAMQKQQGQQAPQQGQVPQGQQGQHQQAPHYQPQPNQYQQPANNRQNQQGVR